MKIQPYFKLKDLWVGLYVDLPNRAMYIGFFPTLGVKISFSRVTLQSPPDANCEICKLPLDIPTAWWENEC